VSNSGAVTVARNGFAALIGGIVSSSGTITVPLGKVGLGSGEAATLDLSGDGFLQVAMPTSATTSNGRALVDVSGRVESAGGLIEIKAATARDAARNAVNVSGTLSANSIRGQSGNIVLSGGYGGDVSVTGRISAVGRRKSKGGSVTVTGKSLALRGAIIDVSGDTGGGLGDHWR